MAAYVLDSASRNIVEIDGVTYRYFGGTNYFGLSYHPEVVSAAQEGLARWGISSAGSRVTTGGARVHEELERAIGAFLGCDDASISCSGYLSDYIVVQALAPDHDICLIDELAHSSLMNALHAAELPHETYRHTDCADLERRLKLLDRPGRRVLVASDGVFSVAGDLAPLREMLALVRRFGGSVLIDDSHGFGAIGVSGRGSIEVADADFDRLYVTGTLSKALGCFGGFSAGNSPLAHSIVSRSSAYIGSTPLPPAISAAALVALRRVREDTDMRNRLRKNVLIMKDGLRALGLVITDSPAPIAMFVIDNEKTNLEIHKRLMGEGILIPYNYYPGGPKGGYFRMVVTAQHSEKQIREALNALKESMRRS